MKDTDTKLDIENLSPSYFTTYVYIPLSSISNYISSMGYEVVKFLVPPCTQLLFYLQAILSPMVDTLHDTPILAPILEFIIKLFYFYGFILLLIFEQLLRFLLTLSIGAHPSGRHISVVNAMDPTFEFFDESIQTSKYLKNNKLFEQRKQQAQPSVLTKMMNRPQYSQSLAYTLSVASKLGYEDLEIIKYELNQAGFDVENTFRPFAYKNICAYVIEKEDMIFLIFRGSNPLNIQNYLTNIDIRMRDVYASWGYMGRVHKGYFDALGDPLFEKSNGKETFMGDDSSNENRTTFWQSLKQLFSNYLDQLSGHWMHQLTDPVDFRFLASEKYQHHYISQRELTMYHQAESYILNLIHQDKNKKLYISGHSLGASLGTMFVAKMVQSSSPLLDYFHGLYTFGQPKLGDTNFSKIFDAKLSSKIFHHVYNNDIIARLPSYSKYATPPGTLVFVESSYDITIYPPDPYTNEPTPVRPISQLHLSGLLNRHVLKRLSEESWIRILFRVLAPYMVNDHFSSEYPKSLKHGQVKWVILGETIDDPHSNTGLTHRPTMMKRKSKIDVSEKPSSLKMTL